MNETHQFYPLTVSIRREVRGPIPFSILLDKEDILAEVERHIRQQLIGGLNTLFNGTVLLTSSVSEDHFQAWNIGSPKRGFTDYVIGPYKNCSTVVSII